MEAVKTNFEEFEKVRILAKGITGTIVDIYESDDGSPHYTVKVTIQSSTE